MLSKGNYYIASEFVAQLGRNIMARCPFIAYSESLDWH
jgi:hypothetical protein